MVALGFAVFFLAEPVLALILGDKYDFTSSLILAAVVGGQLRVARSLLGATMSALADTRGLAVWNGVVWLSIAAMFAGGSVGASWGLEGLLWGVALGRTATVALGGPLIVRPLRSD